VDQINSRMLSNWASDQPPKVLDPCCGTGIFLFDMAHKISEKWSMPIEQVYKECIYGFDIDAEAVDIGLEIMNSSNLSACDSLKQDYTCYDIVVTNPPYIRIQNLTEQQRAFIQNEFDFTGGDTDIYIAFLEKLAKSKVKVGLICPSSWARNKSSSSLREHFYDNGIVEKVVDFGDRLIFEGVQTYTSIMYMGHTETLQYVNSSDNSSKFIAYSSSNPDNLFLGLDNQNKKTTKLSDLCDIKVGLATLADGLFYGECLSEDQSGLVSFKNKYGEYKVEKSILRKCTKASKIQNIKENTYIIYPYTKEGTLIDESVIAHEYPFAYALLSSFKDTLLKRDKGKIKQEKWYGFGRTQGLQSLGPKLLLPPFQKDKIVVREAAAEDMFISGYAVYPKEGHSLTEIKEVLTSDELFNGIKPFAKPMSNGWVGVSKGTFKHYTF